MSWGSTSWGGSPWGSTSEVVPVIKFALISAEPIRENVIRLTFARPVYLSRWHDPYDASRSDCYTIVADTEFVGIDGNPSRPVAVADVRAVVGDGSQIDVWLDRSLSPTGSRYTITVANLVSDDQLAVLDTANASATFQGVQQGLPVLSIDMAIGNRDIANPQMVAPGVSTDQLGHFRYDETGDYGIDQGMVSFKKRVFRRLTTIRGAFRHIPSYGVSIPQSAKKLVRANLTDSLAADAEDQIRQEPETTNVSVSLVRSPNEPGLVVYRIHAKTTLGVVDAFDVPVPV